MAKSRKKKNPDQVRVRVPGTTANLGPGFDCLGMALDLFNEFHVRLSATGRSSLSGRGTCSELAGTNNDLFKTFRRVCRIAGHKPPAIDVLVDGGVPIARGLGSSATAIVAGALSANALCGSPLKTEDLLAPCVAIEGHPDNVAPALLGALTAAVRTPSGVIVHQYAPYANWRVVLLIPDYELSTAKARAAIPKKIPHGDATFNLARVPFVIDALVDGDAAELAAVLSDRLHEPYRKPLVERYDRISRAALGAGAAAVYLSGAGPSMAAFCLGAKTARAAAEAMAAAVRTCRFDAQSVIARCATEGAKVTL